MTNSIALSPEQFIFTQDHELRTDSIMVAEAFGKSHPNVIKSIERVMSQVSDSFGEVNFNATEYEQNNNLGLPTKYKKYDLTKDGFMMVVMGFTGAKAVVIKEAYIGAFNLMHKKLFPARNAIVELPLVNTNQKRHIQEIVNKIARDTGVHQQTSYHNLKTEFNVGKYSELKSSQYPAVCKFFKVKPRHIEGELLAKESLPAKDTPYTSLPAPENAYLKETRDRVRGLHKWALENNHNGIADDLDIIERCLVSSWTHTDESLVRLKTAVGMLERWRNS